MVQSAVSPASSPELEAERAFLTEAKGALARMYADVLVRDIPVIGGEDNDERFTNEANQRAHEQRTQALIDLPGVPLFFGRLDFEPGAVYTADRIYVGRRHVHDADGPPMVVDWRAPVSTVLPGEPHRSAGGPAAPPLRVFRRGRADRVRGREA